MMKMVSSNIFGGVILTLIMISTISLALESPLADPKSTKNTVLTYIDYGMTAIFTLETLAKIIAYGFVVNGPDSYLRVGWNLIDFVVVISSLISYLPQ